MDHRICTKQISGKWKLELLFLMKDQPRRWSELNHLLPQASPNALTRQLRELEEDGLISRRILHDKPPKVVLYRLREPALRPVLEALGSWCLEETEQSYGA